MSASDGPPTPSRVLIRPPCIGIRSQRRLRWQPQRRLRQQSQRRLRQQSQRRLRQQSQRYRRLPSCRRHPAVVWAAAG